MYKLAYYKSEVGNVGDDYSPWLFSRVLGEKSREEAQSILFGVGSILTSDYFQNLGVTTAKKTVVFGSGARSREQIPSLCGSHVQIICVRGPLTALAGRLDARAAVTDPGALAPIFLPAKTEGEGPIGVVPYYRAPPEVWRSVTSALGWRLVSPRQKFESFISELTGCRAVYCESLHGAIFADAYGIPWRAISGTSIPFEGITHAYKWTDWTASIGEPFSPIAIPKLVTAKQSWATRRAELAVHVRIAIHRLSRDFSSNRFQLSCRHVLSSKQDELVSKLTQLKNVLEVPA